MNGDDINIRFIGAERYGDARNDLYFIGRFGWIVH